MNNQEMKNALAQAEERIAQLTDERNTEHENMLSQMARANKADLELSELMESQEMKAIQFIGQFIKNDTDGLSTSTIDGVTTYQIQACGNTYALANKEEAELAKRAIYIARVEKGASFGKYAVLDEVDKRKMYVGFGCKNIAEYGEKVMGLARGSVADYLSTLRTFYNCPTYVDGAENNGYIAVHPYVDGASLTNLKQAKGLYNKDSNAFWAYCQNGELHLSGTLANLKKELNSLDKELPTVTANTDSQSQNTDNQSQSQNTDSQSQSQNTDSQSQNAEVDTPKDRARFYLSKARAELLDCVESEDAKTEVCKIIDGLLKILA